MSNFENLEEKTLEHKRIYEGKILSLDCDTVSLINGSTSSREVIRHCGGVTVLPLDSDGNVTLVDQFRYPLGKVIRELPAGKLDRVDAGCTEEGHLQGAKRELLEETGLTSNKITYLGYMLPTPGFCDEILHMYLAEELTQGEASPDEDEFLNVVKIPFQTLVDQIMSGEIVDGKTITTVLKAKIHLGL